MSEQPERKISVVVPVYNVEDYITRCIDSLLLQDFDSWEIILVDDGSTDIGGKICDEYARQYENVYVYHKPNGGLSDARNYGLARAAGEYVMFVDSDDYLSRNAFSSLAGETSVNGAKSPVDMVIGRAVTLGPSMSMDRFEKVAISQFECHKQYTGKEYLFGCLRGGALRVEAWRSLYRRKFLIDNRLEFKKGVAHEDEDFTPRALLCADSVVLSDCVFYHYDNTRAGSIMNTGSMSRKKAADRIGIYTDLLEIYKNVSPRKLRRLLEDDISWKYAESCCDWGVENMAKLGAKRTVPLKCALTARRRLKGLVFAISPKVYAKFVR